MQDSFESCTKTCLDTNRKQKSKTSYILIRSEYFANEYLPGGAEIDDQYIQVAALFNTYGDMP